MRVFLLQRKVPNLTKSVKEDEAEVREHIRKDTAWKKRKSIFSMTVKVKVAPRRQTIQGRMSPKQASPLSSMNRIHLEEVKRKVRVRSPEAKQFIGPGDSYKNLNRRGGIFRNSNIG